MELELAIAKLRTVLQGKVDDGHGINHALTVLKHAEAALEYCPQSLTESQKLAIKLAALLHDADDSKFFTGTNNAREILQAVTDQETTELALRMIELVSCSKNGNKIVEPEWLLYPRYADRLEAIGEIGIWRCYQYTKHINRRLYRLDTPRASNLEELAAIAPKSRFDDYIAKQGKVGPSSFIDHFYDKLLHICDLGTNSYFQKQAQERKRIMEEFVIYFGIHGDIDHEYISKLETKLK